MILYLNGKNLISLSNAALMSNSNEPIVERLDAWRLEIQVDMEDLEYKMARLKVKEPSVNTRMKHFYHTNN